MGDNLSFVRFSECTNFQSSWKWNRPPFLLLFSLVSWWWCLNNSSWNFQFTHVIFTHVYIVTITPAETSSLHMSYSHMYTLWPIWHYEFVLVHFDKCKNQKYILSVLTSTMNRICAKAHLLSIVISKSVIFGQLVFLCFLLYFYLCDIDITAWYTF